MLIDLHVLIHDGDTDALLETIPATLLDGLCLVELGGLPTPEIVAAARAHGKKVFVAAQIALEKGHILVYPPAEDTDLAPFLKGSDDDQVRALLAAGCALLACHPYDKTTGHGLGDWIVQFTALHGAIAVTAGSTQVANDLALEAIENLDIAAAGGTGSDGPLGKAATLFASDVASQAEFVEEILRSDCWAVGLGSEDRWSSVERRPERPRGRGDRGGRGKGGRDGERRGGRGRGDRDRDKGGRNRSNRGGGDRGRGRGDRTGGRPQGGPGNAPSPAPSTNNRSSAPRGDDRGNRPEQPEQMSEINGNLRNDGNFPPEINGNR